MKTITTKDAIKTITTHYIDRAFVESHGRETMDIKLSLPNNRPVADADDRRALAQVIVG